MNVQYTSVRTASDAEASSFSQAPLQGMPLLLARGLWLLSFVSALIIFVVSIPAYVGYLHRIRPGGVDIYAGQLTSDGLRHLQALGFSIDEYAAGLVGVTVIFVSTWLVVGAVIFWHKSDNRMALFASFMLVLYSVSFGYWAAEVLPTWQIPLLGLNALSGLSIGLCLYVFPDGRFVPRWSRWPFIVGCVIHACCSAFLAAVPLTAYPLLSQVNSLLFLALAASIVAVQIYRYRRVSTAAQRQQTKWVVFGCVLGIAGFRGATEFSLLFASSYGLDVVQPGTQIYLIQHPAIYLSLLFIPLSIGIAILRYRLWDIDLIINRALVYGGLSICIVGMYVFVVGYLGALFRTNSNLLISLIATGLVAVLFQPLRALLQRGANRLLYGQRDEPYTVITALSQRLQVLLAPDDALPIIVETVAQALKLPYAAILLKQENAFVNVASYGQEPGERPTDGETGTDPAGPIQTLFRLPLVHQRETIGTLLLAPRARGEDLTLADWRLLQELTRQVSLVAHAVRLTSDLQLSNEQLRVARAHLVTTREEERRRLRRDLHDGLGSSLTSVTFQLDAASNLLDRDPQAVKLLLKDLKGQVQASIADIRRLVYNLRPPILDEWGVVAALREQVAQYQLNQVQVTVDAPESFPPLPAAVEVAAYRITLEALANVIRHAVASTCTIRLDTTAAELVVVVQDNGVGLPQDYHAGVGINAMRERAAELGGACVIENAADMGTRVYARLPLAKE